MGGWGGGGGGGAPFTLAVVPERLEHVDEGEERGPSRARTSMGSCPRERTSFIIEFKLRERSGFTCYMLPGL